MEARPPSVSAAAEPAPAPAEPDRAEQLAKDVAKAVRQLRTGAGLSERAAARALGTSQTQLRRMEDPRYLPSLRSLARLASVYGYRLRVEFERPGEAMSADEQKRAHPPKARLGRKAARPKRRR